MALEIVAPLEEPSWPESEGRPVTFLVDASSSLERRMILDWIDREQALDLGKILAREMKITSHAVSAEETFAYLGVSV